MTEVIVVRNGEQWAVKINGKVKSTHTTKAAADRAANSSLLRMGKKGGAAENREKSETTLLAPQMETSHSEKTV